MTEEILVHAGNAITYDRARMGGIDVGIRPHFCNVAADDSTGITAHLLKFVSTYSPGGS